MKSFYLTDDKIDSACSFTVKTKDGKEVGVLSLPNGGVIPPMEGLFVVERNSF